MTDNEKTPEEMFVEERRKAAERKAERESAKVIPFPRNWPDTTKSGEPKPSLRNTIWGLGQLKVRGSHDLFKRRKFVCSEILPQGKVEVNKDVGSRMRQALIDRMEFDPGTENVREALNIKCLENEYHPIKQYLDGLSWDGRPRLEKWLITYLGAEDTLFNRAVAKIVLVAAVRRIRCPGCKFDNVMVIENRQGTGKSSVVRILAGDEYFSDQSVLTSKGRDAMEELEGIWIYELGELSGIRRAEVEHVKSFLSRMTDRGRMAYGEYREDRPRESILIGTTNDDKYLRDSTGNRRWWPVKAVLIDLGALRRDRDQLWAEANYCEKEGASLELPEALWETASQHQHERLETDPWEELLQDFGIWDLVTETEIDKEHVEQRVRSKDLLTSVLSMTPDKQTEVHGKRVANCMRKHGWKGPRQLWIEGGNANGYSRIVLRKEPGKSRV